MKAKTVGIVAGAGLLGIGAVAANRGKAMHQRCKEACARMADQGSTKDDGTHRCAPSPEEAEPHQGCGPAACRK